MERINKTKKFFTLKKVSPRRYLEKEYSKKDKTISGEFSLVPKQEVKVTSVTFEVLQTMKIEDETTVISLGKKTIKWRGELKPITGKRMEFTVPISYEKSKKEQKKIYKGEMALMDRVHDESQKQRYTYEIIASAKLSWVKEKIDFSRKIVVK